MRYLAIARYGAEGEGVDLAALGRSLNMDYIATSAWQVLTDPRMPVRRLADDTLLLGHVFDRATNQDYPGTDECPRSTEDPFGRAAHLIRHGWGSYLAFGARVDDGRPYCLRDPSGGLPAFYTYASGRLALGSGVDVLHEAGAVVATVDWNALAVHFLFNQAPGPQTCIEDVAELTAGATITLEGTMPRERQHWAPAPFALATREIEMAAAADGLCETILACLGAWSRCYRRPLIELSGGLDSSIVAAALTAMGRERVAITLVTPGRDGDERRLARDVANHLDLSLVERERDAARLDLRKAIAPHLPRPGVRGFTQESDRLIGAAASDLGADALFSGGGGDSLFCMLGSAAPLVDHFRAGGEAAALLRTACDAADASHETIWSLAGQILRPTPTSWIRPRKGRARLISHRGVEFASPAASPLLAGAPALPPGHRAHVEEIVGISNYLVGMGRGSVLPLVFPLMSQPIVEACLALPTWLWVQGGQDRAVARHAFSKLLPRHVVFRRSKGRLDAFGHLLFDQHRDTLRILLLEGKLASSGLLDRDEVERQLAATAPARTTSYFLLLELADISAWVEGVSSRSWTFH